MLWIGVGALARNISTSDMPLLSNTADWRIDRQIVLRGSAEVRRNRPVRINVSRSGIGASVGVRGARLSVGPRGTYITLSAYGVRYRQRIDGKSKRPRPATTEHLFTDSGLITTVSVTDLVDASSEQILNAINSRLSSKAWAVPTFVALIALACGLIWANVSEAAGLLVGCGGALTAFIANLIVRRWRSTTIYYELDEQSKKRYGYIEEGCSRLARAAAKWRYVSAAPTTDWKRNAGANVLTRRTPLQVVRQPAPFLKTNVEPWVVSSKGISLVFLPDCLFVWDGKRYGSVPYDRVTVSADTVSFREDRWVPRDTTVIDHTWHFVRKDGGPDRRFNGNRRIPICCYGTVTVCSEHGLYIELCVSNPGCAEEFARYVSHCTVTNNVDRANHATGGPPEASNLVPYSPLASPSQPVPIASLIPPPSAPIAPLPQAIPAELTVNVLNGSVTLQLSYKVMGQETVIHQLRILPRYALEFLAVLDATAEHIGALRQQGRLFHVDDHKPPHDDVTVLDVAQPIPADKGTVHVALLLTRGRHGTIRLRLRGESQYGGKSGSDDGYLTDERLEALRSDLRLRLVRR